MESYLNVKLTHSPITAQ